MPDIPDNPHAIEAYKAGYMQGFDSAISFIAKVLMALSSDDEWGRNRGRVILGSLMAALWSDEEDARKHRGILNAALKGDFELATEEMKRFAAEAPEQEDDE